MDLYTSVVNKKNINVLVYHHAGIPLLFLKRIWNTRSTGIVVSWKESGLINKWICLSGATSGLNWFEEQ